VYWLKPTILPKTLWYTALHFKVSIMIYCICIFDVRGSVHHNTILKENTNKMQKCIKILLFHIYMKLNMFLATHRPSSGVCAWQHTVPDNVHQLHVQQPSTYEKPEGASAVLGSWWWAVCRPKHVEFYIICNQNVLINCCILLDFSLWIVLRWRIHEHQVVEWTLQDSVYNPAQCTRRL